MSNNAQLLDPAITALSDLMPQGLEHLERADIVPYPYSMVDASLDWFLRRNQDLFQQGITTQRRQETSGSVRYLLQFKDPDQALRVAVIWVRMVGDRATHISIIPGGFQRPVYGQFLLGYVEYLHAVLTLFINWLSQEHLRTVQYLTTRQEAQADALAAPQPDPAKLRAFLDEIRSKENPPRRGGPYSWPEDDWAWEQVNIEKQPRRKVRAEWENRLSPDRPRLQDMDRSFRHAVGKTRKSVTPES